MRLSSISIAILGTLLYHVTQKSTSRAVNPFFSLVVTYSVAMALCLAALLVAKPDRNVQQSWAQLNWATFGCGVSIFAAELGYLLAYRAGWNLKSLGLIANVIVAIVLVPVGVMLFGEDLQPRTITGIVLCVTGLVVLLG